MENAIVQSKVEKITAAIYIVTNIIADVEPLKWKIREVSLTLLLESYKTEDMCRNLVSVLDVAYYGGMISDMNRNVLKDEILKLGEKLKSEKGVLSSLFFDNGKEQLKPLNTTILGAPLLEKNKEKQGKSIRQTTIIDMLRKQPSLTIKDFTRAIKDCSEKTIQRELIALIKKGILNRKGERRWSTYSLVTL